MPTYEYECTKCGHVFEKFQSMTAEPVKRCPLCRCKVRKLFGTGAGFVFKGAPVSETDYRLSKSYKEGKKKEKASESKPATSGDKKKATSTGSDKKKAAASS